MMNDNDTPTRATSPDKTQGGGWSSDSETVERRDRDLPADGSAQPSGGISNRPIEEEQENQTAVPPRGETKK